MIRKRLRSSRLVRSAPPSCVQKRDALRAGAGAALILVALTACNQSNVPMVEARSTAVSTLVPSPTPAAKHRKPSINASPVAPIMPSSTPVPTVAATAGTTGQMTAGSDAALDDFKAQMDELIEDIPAHVGIVVERPDGSVLYEPEAGTLFESASLYKLAIMVEVYRERDEGELSFDDLVTLYPGFFSEDDSVYGYGPNVYGQIPAGTLMDNMIMLSRNVAATALLDLVGTDRVNEMAKSIGMTSTKILWYPSEGVARTKYRLISFRARTNNTADPSADGAYNVTTPADIALLFERLLQGQIISPATGAEMLDLLARQEINDRLPAMLPDGTRVAHKTGDLDNSVHDAGAIYGPNGPVVVAVLSDEVENREAVTDFIQQVARLAYALPSD